MCDQECDRRSGLTSKMLTRAAENVSRQLFIHESLRSLGLGTFEHHQHEGYLKAHGRM